MKKVLILIFAIMLVTPLVSANWDSLRTSLISYHSFDDDLTDELGYYDVQPNEGTISYSAGVINNGVETDTNKNLMIPHQAHYDFTDEIYTINLWYRTDSWDNDGQVLHKYDGGSNDWKIYEYNTGGTEGIALNYMTSDNLLLLDTFNRVNTWIMFTAVGNATDVCGYINGTLSSCEAVKALVGNTIPIMIGVADNNASEADGDFDELAIWNRSLSASEISTLWNSGNGLDYTPPATSVTLNSPADASTYLTNPANVTFNATISHDSNNIENASLEIYVGTTLTYYHTMNFSGSNTEEEFNVTYFDIPEGSYTWNIRGEDNSGSVAYASANRSFTVNSTQLITFNILDYFGSGITFGWIKEATKGMLKSGQSPYYNNMTAFVSNSTESYTATFEVRDYNYYNIWENFTFPMTSANTTINLTLDPNKLVLNFTEKVYGDITYPLSGSNRSVVAFNDTEYVIIQRNMSEGDVLVKFGSTYLAGENWTQYYEYYNDYTDHIYENLDVADDLDTLYYVRVIDESKAGIPDADVFMSCSDNITTSEQNMTLHGRRLSNDEGYTFFWVDNKEYCQFQVGKDEFATSYMVKTPGDEDRATEDTALNIQISKSGATLINGAQWFLSGAYYTNTTTDIRFGVTAFDATRVQVTTDKRIADGLEKKDSYDSNWNNYYFALYDGTDFDASDTDSFSVYLYVDGSLHSNRTITKVNEGTTNIFSSQTFDAKTTRIIVGLGLIVIAGTVGAVAGSTSAGATVFMLGSLVAAFFDPWFAIISLLGLIYYVSGPIGRLLRKD